MQYRMKCSGVIYESCVFWVFLTAAYYLITQNCVFVKRLIFLPGVMYFKRYVIHFIGQRDFENINWFWQKYHPNDNASVYLQTYGEMVNCFISFSRELQIFLWLFKYSQTFLSWYQSFFHIKILCKIFNIPWNWFIRFHKFLFSMSNSLVKKKMVHSIWELWIHKWTFLRAP